MVSSRKMTSAGANCAGFAETCPASVRRPPCRRHAMSCTSDEPMVSSAASAPRSSVIAATISSHGSSPMSVAVSHGHCSRSAFFSSELVMPMTLAPRAYPACAACAPTPPLTPVTMSVSPGARRHASTALSATPIGEAVSASAGAATPPGSGYERFRWHGQHLRESAVAPVADLTRKDDGTHAEERCRDALSDGAHRARDLVAEHARERNAAPQRPLHDERVVVREAARRHAEDGFSRPWLRIRERGVAQAGRRARRFEDDGSHATILCLTNLRVTLCGPFSLEGRR